MTEILEVINKFIRDVKCGGITYEESKNGRGSILNFNPIFLMTFGWLMPKRGSIFNLLESIMLTGTQVFIVTFVAKCDCRVWKSDYCIDLPVPSVSYFTLLTLCAFVIAFFANTVLTRWWTVRMHMQVVMGSSPGLIIHITSMITASIRFAPAESRPSLTIRAKYITKRLSSHLIVMFRQLINMARKTKHLADLCDDKTLTREELSYLQSISGSPVNGTCALITTLIQEAGASGLLGRNGGMGDTNLNFLLIMTENIRSNCTNVLTYIDVQLPYPFVQIVACIVYASLIQLLYLCSCYVAAGISAKRTDGVGNITTGYITIILYSFVLFGLMRLFDLLENPLGEDAADFPISTYFNTLKANVEASRLNAFALIESNGAFGPVVASKYGDEKVLRVGAMNFEEIVLNVPPSPRIL